MEREIQVCFRVQGRTEQTDLPWPIEQAVVMVCRRTEP